MTRVRFHSELYSGFAVDEAVKVFAEHAEFHLVKESDSYLVELTSKGDTPEGLVADELANYALGRTIERGRSTGTPTG